MTFGSSSDGSFNSEIGVNFRYPRNRNSRASGVFIYLYNVDMIYLRQKRKPQKAYGRSHAAITILSCPYVAAPAKQMSLQRQDEAHLDHQHHGALHDGPGQHLVGLDQVGGLAQAIADPARGAQGLGHQ